MGAATHLGMHLRDETEQAVVRFGEHLVAKRIAPRAGDPLLADVGSSLPGHPGSGIP